jgi:DNA-binding MarR family transcriptional regulator
METQPSPEANQSQQQDGVARILAQWARERPDLDATPMGVIGRISRLARIFEHEIQDVFATFGLHRGEFDVLATLRRAGAPYRLNPTELSTTLMISSGGMTNRLNRLEQAGLITRQPDPTDRRGSLVGLTDEGQRLVDAAVTAHVANEHRLLHALSPADRETLASLLRNLLLGFEAARQLE